MNAPSLSSSKTNANEAGKGGEKSTNTNSVPRVFPHLPEKGALMKTVDAKKNAPANQAMGAYRAKRPRASSRSTRIRALRKVVLKTVCVVRSRARAFCSLRRNHPFSPQLPHGGCHGTRRRVDAVPCLVHAVLPNGDGRGVFRKVRAQAKYFFVLQESLCSVAGSSTLRSTSMRHYCCRPYYSTRFSTAVQSPTWNRTKYALTLLVWYY